MNGSSTVSDGASSAVLDLRGRVAVVTGGGRGLGAEIAYALAQAGADVSVWDAPDWPDAPVSYLLSTAEEVEATVARIADLGGKAAGIAVDVRDLAQVESAVSQTLASFGRIDILVCAAGIRSGVTAAEMTDEQWHGVVDTNLHGTYHAIRSTLGELERSGSGRVVVVSAEEGRRGAHSLSHYAAAAWAQIGLAKSLAVEAAENGVAVSVVCPGPMDTTMSSTEDFWRLAQAGRAGTVRPAQVSRPEAEHALRVRHPAHTAYVSTEAVTRAVLFLVTQPALDMTGSVLDVSAGMPATNTV